MPWLGRQRWRQANRVPVSGTARRQTGAIDAEYAVKARSVLLARSETRARGMDFLCMLRRRHRCRMQRYDLSRTKLHYFLLPRSLGIAALV